MMAELHEAYSWRQHGEESLLAQPYFARETHGRWSALTHGFYDTTTRPRKTRARPTHAMRRIVRNLD